MDSGTYSRRYVRSGVVTILPATRGGVLPHPAVYVSALYEVHVVLIVTARPHQDTQEVHVVAQVLQERRPRSAERTTEGVMSS